VTILIWALAVAGSALIITQSSIFASLRDWLESKADGAKKTESMWSLPYASWLSKLAHCPMCSGFWLGAFWTHVLLASPWVAPAHPRLSAALWLFAGGCAGSVLSACGVATWLFLDEAKMAFGLWRYLKTPKEPRRKIPRMMSPDKNEGAFVNWTTRAIVCSCGTVVTSGQSHTMTEDCDGTTSLDVRP